jgi:hypothetical protein
MATIVLQIGVIWQPKRMPLVAEQFNGPRKEGEEELLPTRAVHRSARLLVFWWICRQEGRYSHSFLPYCGYLEGSYLKEIDTRAR